MAYRLNIDVVDAFLAELIFDDGDALAVFFGEDAVEQSGFARAKEARLGW